MKLYKNRKFWLIFGYFILLIDCVIEYTFITTIVPQDPDFLTKQQSQNQNQNQSPGAGAGAGAGAGISGGPRIGYSGCNGDTMTEINDNVSKFKLIGNKITFLRCFTASLIILCYYMTFDGKGKDDNDNDDDDDDDENKSIENEANSTEGGDTNTKVTKGMYDNIISDCDTLNGNSNSNSNSNSNRIKRNETEMVQVVGQ